jgi:hypothetical protein
MGLMTAILSIAIHVSLCFGGLNRGPEQVPLENTMLLLHTAFVSTSVKAKKIVSIHLLPAIFYKLRSSQRQLKITVT